MKRNLKDRRTEVSFEKWRAESFQRVRKGSLVGIFATAADPRLDLSELVLVTSASHRREFGGAVQRLFPTFRKGHAC